MPDSIHHRGQDNNLNVRHYGRLLKRWAWLPVLCAAVAAGSAYFASLQLPSTYEAHVSVLVRPAQPLGVQQGVAVLTADQVTRTYAQLMTEPPILKQVAQDTGVSKSPETLAQQIKITPQTDTTILDVAVQDSNPQLARDIANTLVNDFIANVKKIDAQEGADQNSRLQDNLVVVSPASVPTSPVFPKPIQNAALAAAAAFLLAVGFVLLRDHLDQTVKNGEDLTARTGLLPIGQVPFARSSKKRLGELLAVKSGSPISEAYRTLRTNLLFSSLDRPLKSIVVTSPLPGEGKSRTAANLAVVLAGAGQKTLLVDADFRRPSQHRIFNQLRNRGLSDVILHPGQLQDLLTPVPEIPELWLLTNGTAPPNPSELLNSPRMLSLLAELQAGFSYLVIDTPPVNAVTDATILAARTDGTLVVVEYGRTSFAAAVRSKQALDRVGARVVGAVINKMRAADAGYYAYAYYGEKAFASNGKDAAEPETKDAAQPPVSLGSKAPPDRA